MIEPSVPEAEAVLEAARDTLAAARRAHDAAMLAVGEAALRVRQARQAAADRRRLN
jgi:hypothetical protein